jgi:hypothetical protein
MLLRRIGFAATAGGTANVVLLREQTGLQFQTQSHDFRFDLLNLRLQREP